jgi:hypothetical protein
MPEMNCMKACPAFGVSTLLSGEVKLSLAYQLPGEQPNGE